MTPERLIAVSFPGFFPALADLLPVASSLFLCFSFSFLKICTEIFIVSQGALRLKIFHTMFHIVPLRSASVVRIC